jgi:hypothetical protein
MKKFFLIIIPILLSCAQIARTKATYNDIEGVWIFYYNEGHNACQVFLREDFYAVSYISDDGIESNEDGKFAFKNDTLYFTTRDGIESKYSQQEVYFIDEQKETLHIGHLGEFQRMDL